MGAREKMQAFQTPSQRQSQCLDFVRALLDEASFAEQDSQLSSPSYLAHKRHSIPGDGLICGSGSIDQKLVLIAAQDADVFKGAVGKVHAQKFVKICQQAKKEHLPLIAVFDSAGVRAEEGLQALEALADMYDAFAETSKHVTTIVLVKGPVAGGLSLLLPHASVVIMTGENAGVFLQGPGVTQAKNQSDASVQDIGGARTHAEKTGLATFATENVQETAKLIQKLLSYQETARLLQKLLSYQNRLKEWSDDPNRLAPELNEIAAASDEIDIDIEKIQNLIFDKDSLLTLYKDFAPEWQCSLARLGGAAVAVIAQHKAPITKAAAQKLKKFLFLAQQFKLPLITLNGDLTLDQTPESEQQGVVNQATELIDTIYHPDQIRLNVYLGKTHGTALLIQHANARKAKYHYAWPTAQIGLLNNAQALALFGTAALEASADPIKERPQLEDACGEQYASLKDAAAAGFIDEIIWPEATRPYLYRALQRSGDAL